MLFIPGHQRRHPLLRDSSEHRWQYQEIVVQWQQADLTSSNRNLFDYEFIFW